MHLANLSNLFEKAYILLCNSRASLHNRSVTIVVYGTLHDAMYRMMYGTIDGTIHFTIPHQKKTARFIVVEPITADEISGAIHGAPCLHDGFPTTMPLKLILTIPSSSKAITK